MTSKPIFFDSKQKRWRIVRTVSFWTIVFFATTFLTLGIRIWLNPLPQLPALSTLKPSNITPNKTTSTNSPVILSPALINQLESLPGATTKLMPQRVAIVVNWDDKSFESLRSNLEYLDVVVGEWLHLTDDGKLTEDNPAQQQKITDTIKNGNKKIKIWASLDDYQNGHLNKGALSALKNKSVRQQTISELLEYLKKNNLQGLVINLKNLSADTTITLNNFINELAPELKTNKLQLIIETMPENNSLDYSSLSQTADYIMVVTTDEHSPGTTAGPITSLSRFINSARISAKAIPPDKLIILTGNYAYDWLAKQSGAEQISFGEAMTLAGANENGLRTDPASLTPTFTYQDKQKKLHEVWLTDATTAYNEWHVASRLQVAGFAIARLGLEDPTLWQVLSNDSPEIAASNLTIMRPGFGAHYEGDGDILKFTASPTNGERRVYTSTYGIITHEEIFKPPSISTITRYGANPKMVALTFDDGPDPNFTPQILNILKEYNVPATFFVIGSQAQKYPDILRQEMESGHDIGNHTFSHTRIETTSSNQLHLEISLAQRIIESITGKSTHLYRPPYSEELGREGEVELASLKRLTELQYLTVDSSIDPKDWQPDAAPIIKSVLGELNTKTGNVILLHDGGADRSKTVQALPQLIQELRNAGYSFGTVSHLMNKPQSDLLTGFSQINYWQILAQKLGFSTITIFKNFIQFMFASSLALSILRLVVSLILADYQKKRPHLGKRRRGKQVDIILPAHNEAKVINKTIYSLLQSHRSFPIKIIVVDDGSTDNTAEIVTSEFGNHPLVSLYRKINGGKASALNFGLTKSNGEVVITLDADTIFLPDTLNRLVSHFSDPRVGAVAGNTKVGNRNKIITQWQALEYIISQNLDRRAFDLINCITVVPGSVGAWRRQAIMTVGGFSPATLAEDADLTITVRRQGYRIIFEEQAIALTEAPDTIRGFMRQRFRWMYGTFQAIWKHKVTLFNPRYGTLGMVALPNILFLQIFYPLIIPLVDFSLIFFWLLRLFNLWENVLGDANNTFWTLYLIFLSIDLTIAYFAFSLENKEDKRLLLWVPIQRLFYRFLIFYITVKSIATALKGIRVGWAKIERKATVPAG